MENRTRSDAAKKSFSWSSTNLWTVVLTFLFGTLTLTGLELTQSPADTAAELVYTVTTQGWIGSIGIILTNLVNIGYHIFFKSKGSFWSFLGSPNFYVNLVSALISVIVVFVPNAIIPADTAQQIVSAAYSQDWTGLIVLLFMNLVTPLIRAFRDAFAK